MRITNYTQKSNKKDQIIYLPEQLKVLRPFTPSNKLNRKGTLKLIQTRSPISYQNLFIYDGDSSKLISQSVISPNEKPSKIKDLIKARIKDRVKALIYQSPKDIIKPKTPFYQRQKSYEQRLTRSKNCFVRQRLSIYSNHITQNCKIQSITLQKKQHPNRFLSLPRKLSSRGMQKYPRTPKNKIITPKNVNYQDNLQINAEIEPWHVEKQGHDFVH